MSDEHHQHLPEGERLDADAVCGSCGTVNPEDTLLCKSCGNNLRDQRQTRIAVDGPGMEPMDMRWTISAVVSAGNGWISSLTSQAMKRAMNSQA